MELKETLLMPKTDFPMRGNLPKREPQIEQKWYDENIYQRVLDKNKDKRRTSLREWKYSYGTCDE